jgi:hypothetical protein
MIGRKLTDAGRRAGAGRSNADRCVASRVTDFMMFGRCNHCIQRLGPLLFARNSVSVVMVHNLIWLTVPQKAAGVELITTNQLLRQTDAVN